MTSETKSKLAKAVGVSRPTLNRYLKQSGAPKRGPDGWNVEQVRRFILEHTRSGAVAASVDSDIASLRKWQVYESARKTKIFNDRAAKLTMPVVEAERIQAEQAAVAQKELNTIPQRLAPDLAGRTVVEIERLLKRAIGDAIGSLRDACDCPDCKPSEKHQQ